MRIHNAYWLIQPSMDQWPSSNHQWVSSTIQPLVNPTLNGLTAKSSRSNSYDRLAQLEKTMPRLPTAHCWIPRNAPEGDRRRPGGRLSESKKRMASQSKLSPATCSWQSPDLPDASRLNVGMLIGWHSTTVTNRLIPKRFKLIVEGSTDRWLNLPEKHIRKHNWRQMFRKHRIVS